LRKRRRARRGQSTGICWAQLKRRFAGRDRVPANLVLVFIGGYDLAQALRLLHPR
jgi:hypothetical protein